RAGAALICGTGRREMVILTKVRSMRWSWGRAAMVAGFVGVAAAAFVCGRSTFRGEAQAAPLRPQALQQPQQPTAASPAPSPEYTREVVAYIYGNVPITRQDLGEYLIAREGTSKLDLLINRRIVETACRQAGIDVTADEIKAAIEQDLKGLGNITLKDF